MYKDNLFNLIRNEEVVIWAGAGLSLYAGYPSGQTLTDKLYNSLTDNEKQNICQSSNLPTLAEEIYRIKGGNKNHIIKILNSIFSKKPDSISTHEIISKIPHLKCIITTNYDKLFELAYQQNYNLILNNVNIPYINKEQIQIFKVHGDLSNPDSIIITNSDYNNFFKENSENSTYWSVIKERLSTNAVLFLGYNLEDPNISVIFDKITDNLKDNKKERFLVAPSLPQHKVNDLIRKGISYIDSKAETLLDELIKNIKNNIVEDLENKMVTADTFTKFLYNFDLLPSISATENSYNVTSVKGINGKQVEGKINFTLNNKNNILEKLKNFTEGKEFGELEIDESIIQNADLFFSDIKIGNKEKLIKFKFQSTPKFDTSINIRFESGYEIEDFPVKLYAGKDIIEIHSQFNTAKFLIKIEIANFPKMNFKFNYKPATIYLTTKKELEIFNLLKNISSGESFTIFTNNGNKINQKLQKFDDLNNEMNFLVNYFDKLQKIEKYFNIHFKNFSPDEITEESYYLISDICDTIDNGYVIINFEDEICFELIENFSETTLIQIKEIGKNNFPIVAAFNKEEIQVIHGQKINLGYKKLEYLNPQVINMNEVLLRKTNIVRVKCEQNSCRLSYSKTKLNEGQ